MSENKLRVGDKLSGFTVNRVREVEDVRSTAIELEHEKSGARVFHLLCDDPENLFAVAFRTPPKNNTGLPHILEHTVLCGSKKYPVKDPFVELLKTSLATFLNAMTYPDKTVYPCASMNEKDFFNIASVYCDAAFRPNISEMHFKQEGHHFDFKEPGNTGSELLIKGIVYNEMKGAYSDLDGVIDKEESARLFTSNEYGNDYGGDPDCIPELTYAEFVNFHKTYYHPANSFIFIYGNIPTAKHLEFLDSEYLSAYDKIDIDTAIKPLELWEKPAAERIAYPASAGDTPEKNSAVTLTWATGESTDAVENLALNILDDYLLGNAAAPLRRAIVDSKLGEDLTSSGYADYQRDTFFTVGIKGTGEDKAADFLDIVLKTCQSQVESGVDRKMIEAAFHHLEMAALDIPSQYPLRLMDRVYRSWIYDCDPVTNLNLRQNLAVLCKRYEETEGYFEKLIKRKILENSYRLLLTFYPDVSYNARKDEEFTAKMAQTKSSLTAAELERVATEAAELDAMQQSPNTPEALETLPKLVKDDVAAKPATYDFDSIEVGAGQVLDNKIYSGGIDFIHLSVDISDFDQETLEFMPVFADVITKVGAAGLDYAGFAQKEVGCCSGIGATLSAAGRVDSFSHVVPYLSFVVKGVQRKLPEMLAVLRERLLDSDFSDVQRLKDILLQSRVGRKTGIVPQGHTVAAAYAGKEISSNIYLSEKFGGISPLRQLDRLINDYDPDYIISRLQKISRAILDAGRFDMSIAGSEESRAAILVWYRKLQEEMGSNGFKRGGIYTPVKELDGNGKLLGLAVPADVAFVARALPGVSADSPLAPALSLLSQNLSYGYLWNEVRAKRGAYGCKAASQALAGIYTLASYRDPCIAETLKTYDGILDYIKNDMDLSPEGIEQAIIGTVKNFDIPFRPATVVTTAISHLRSGSSYDVRCEFRRRLLGLDRDSIVAAAELVFAPEQVAAAPVCVLSSKEKLEQAVAAGLKLEIESI